MIDGSSDAAARRANNSAARWAVIPSNLPDMKDRSR
jgi:hypothetical protein